MRKLVIFSGTTEGRILSGMLSDSGIDHTVCVATAYGDELMKHDTCAEIRIGRMDEAQMTDFLTARGFGAEDMVIDATHPYAAEATANIRAAAAHAGTGYIRILRAQESADTEGLCWYEDMAACAGALEKEAGRILLTTGSKELALYCAGVSEDTRERTFVRILPVLDSLESCLSAGIPARNIIAMQGPFTVQMNLAILQQYGIRHLVTKESGAAGGFAEKVNAAREAGVLCHVIRRPETEQGVDIREAYRQITGTDYQQQDARHILLAGYGTGSPETVLCGVRHALEEADAVFGADRLIEPLPIQNKYAMYRAEEIIPILEAHPEIRSAVILFSGDSGFYSGAGKLYDKLKEWDAHAEIRILPGISAVSLLAARCGVSYDDAGIISLHGRKSPIVLNRLLHMVRFHRKTFVLLSGEEDVRELGELLFAADIGGRIHVGIDLSYPQERLATLTPEEAMAYHAQGIQTALIVHEAAAKRPIVPVLPDEALIRDQVPMTKACIRHESILRLGLKEGDVVYDIGGGTGSVALEIAALDPSLSVYTIEKDPAACRLIEKNADSLAALNVTVIHGEAPEAFADVEAPDCVFIGGSGGRLRQILTALRNRQKEIRCVINAVTLETMEETRRLIEELEPADVEILQVSCSQVREIGGYHMLQAQNPVMIFSFRIG